MAAENLQEKYTKEQSDQQEAYAEIVRTLWRHENDLLNARFTWFTTLQGLLFTALAFAWDKQVPVLINVLCMLGSIVALSSTGIFLLGNKAWGKLQDWWEEHLIKKGYSGPEVTGLPDRPPRFTWTFRSIARLVVGTLLIPWHILPFAFLFAWIIIAIYCPSSPSVQKP